MTSWQRNHKEESEMTDGMLRLAGMAEKITPPGAVPKNDLGFTPETGGAWLKKTAKRK